MYGLHRIFDAFYLAVKNALSFPNNKTIDQIIPQDQFRSSTSRMIQIYRGTRDEADHISCRDENNINKR